MLRIVEHKDALGMYEWMHDDSIMHSFRFDGKSMTKEKIHGFIEQAQKGAEEGKNYHFAIVDENDEYLGTVSLKNVDTEAKNAEYAICLRSKAHGTGIASQATREVLQYAFNVLELKRVYLNVFSDNVRAINLYERNGFVYEGEWRQHIWCHGELKSLSWYGMMKEEYQKYRWNK